MRFSHLQLENWRNFIKLNIPLNERVFVVGPNASGKSNFMDVFRFLRDIASVGGGLQEAVRRRGGVSRLRCLAARRYPDLVIDVELKNEHTAWRYRLQFTQDNQSRPFVRNEDVWKNDISLLHRPDDLDTHDPERQTQTHLEQVTANKEFRELADFFASVRYTHLVPQLVREPDRSIGRQQDPYGGDFLEQIARQSKPTRESRLGKIREALKVAVPQLNELELARDERGTPHLRGLYTHWRPKGAWQNEDQFSDGTLRLIGLLWSLIDGKGPLLLEEPELSLHPEIVQHVPQMIARIQRKSPRQVFISTHSTDLLRDQGIGLDEVLLLLPSEEGTVVTVSHDDSEIVHLLEGGLTMADAVFPKTRPSKAYQLPMFGDQA